MVDSNCGDPWYPPFFYHGDWLVSHPRNHVSWTIWYTRSVPVDNVLLHCLVQCLWRCFGDSHLLLWSDDQGSFHSQNLQYLHICYFSLYWTIFVHILWMGPTTTSKVWLWRSHWRSHGLYRLVTSSGKNCCVLVTLQKKRCLRKPVHSMCSTRMACWLTVWLDGLCTVCATYWKSTANKQERHHPSIHPYLFYVTLSSWTKQYKVRILSWSITLTVLVKGLLDLYAVCYIMLLIKSPGLLLTCY
jgi:hypothetical protein